LFFFEEKEPKNFCPFAGLDALGHKWTKVFLLLFLQKKKILASLT